MSTITRTQRRYDHRLPELVLTTVDVGFAIGHGVHSSTARAAWLWWMLPSARWSRLDNFYPFDFQLEWPGLLVTEQETKSSHHAGIKPFVWKYSASPSGHEFVYRQTDFDPFIFLGLERLAEVLTAPRTLVGNH